MASINSQLDSGFVSALAKSFREYRNHWWHTSKITTQMAELEFGQKFCSQNGQANRRDRIENNLFPLLCLAQNFQLSPYYKPQTEELKLLHGEWINARVELIAKDLEIFRFAGENYSLPHRKTRPDYFANKGHLGVVAFLGTLSTPKQTTQLMGLSTLAMSFKRTRPCADVIHMPLDQSMSQTTIDRQKQWLWTNHLVDPTSLPTPINAATHLLTKWEAMQDAERLWGLQYLAAWVRGTVRLPQHNLESLCCAVNEELLSAPLKPYMGHFEYSDGLSDEEVFGQFYYSLRSGWQLQRWSLAFAAQVAKRLLTSPRKVKERKLTHAEYIFRRDEQVDTSPSSLMEQSFILTEEVNAYITRLTPKELEVLNLKIAGHSRSGIAEIMDMTPRGVQTLLQRARETARGEAERLRAVEADQTPKAARKRRVTA